jgi:hypothetical protein
VRSPGLLVALLRLVPALLLALFPLAGCRQVSSGFQAATCAVEGVVSPPCPRDASGTVQTVPVYDRGPGSGEAPEAHGAFSAP